MNFENITADTRGRLLDVVRSIMDKSKSGSREAAYQAVEAALHAAKDADATITSVPPVQAGPLSEVIPCQFLAQKRETDTNDAEVYGPHAAVVDASDPTLFVVLQGEVGVAVPPLGRWPPAEDEMIRVPSFSIASFDATSCLIVAARGCVTPRGGDGSTYFASATSLGHFDCSGDKLTEGLQTLYSSLLNALRHQWERYQRDGGDASLETDLLIEWYLIGGMVDARHTLPLMHHLVGVFFFWLFLPRNQREHVDEVFGKGASTRGHPLPRHRLRPDGLCFWTLNTEMTKRNERTVLKCLARGLRINLTSGAPDPVEPRIGSRHYPCKTPRSLCFLGDRDSIVGLHPSITGATYRVANPDGSLTEELRSINFNEWLTMTQSRQHHYLESNGGDGQGLLFPIVISNYGINPMPELGGITRAEALKYSTTPETEPIDFPDEMVEKLNFVARINSEVDFFGFPPMPLLIQ